MAVGTPHSSTDEPNPGVTLTQTPAGPCAVVVGRWIAAQLTMRDVWASAVAALQAVPPGTKDWDLRPMQSVDHLGAQLGRGSRSGQPVRKVRDQVVVTLGTGDRALVDRSVVRDRARWHVDLVRRAR